MVDDADDVFGEFLFPGAEHCLHFNDRSESVCRNYLHYDEFSSSTIWSSFGAFQSSSYDSQADLLGLS